jgi:hypothetical protein
MVLCDFDAETHEISGEQLPHITLLITTIDHQ